MWALVDCDNFFCSCERVFRPDLNGVPVVVLSNNDGCVVARSAETKAMGIRLGLPYFEMLRDFPGRGIIAFSSNYKLYGDMSARIMTILRQESPFVCQYSIDEAFINLSGMEKIDLKSWGEELSKKILKWTGMPVSIGIAPTKTLAKVASRYAKKYPGYRKCCMIATEEQRLKALERFEVGDVWGIGRRISRSLADVGITTAAQFAARPRSWVKSHYHVTGERTWMELHGISAIELDQMDVERKSIMTSRSFPGMITDFGDLRTHVANYAARCAAKLRQQNSVCGMVTVFIDSNHFREDLQQYGCSGSLTFATSTSATIEIVEAATRILKSIFRSGIHYKRAGVMVNDISSASAIQPDLFVYNQHLSEKHRSISEAIDEINRRMGADTIVLGSQQYAETDDEGKHKKFAQAIRRSLKSPDYTTKPDSFEIK